MSPLGECQPAVSVPRRAQKSSQSHYGLIIVSSKSYDLESSIEDFANAMGPDSRVLPLLNGMRHLDVLDARFGARRVLGGLARISSTLDARRAHSSIGHVQCPRIRISRKAAETPIERCRRGPARAGIRGADERRHPARDVGEVGIHRRGSVDDQLHARNHRRHHGSRARRTSRCGYCRNALPSPPRTASRRARAPRKPRLAVLTAPGSAFTASMLRDIEQGSRIEADHIVGDLSQAGFKSAAGAAACRRPSRT